MPPGRYRSPPTRRHHGADGSEITEERLAAGLKVGPRRHHHSEGETQQHSDPYPDDFALGGYLNSLGGRCAYDCWESARSFGRNGRTPLQAGELGEQSVDNTRHGIRLTTRHWLGHAAPKVIEMRRCGSLRAAF